MSKYTFKHESSHLNGKVEVEFEAETLDEIFEQFKYFLQGSSFIIDSEDNIELIKKDEIVLTREEYEDFNDSNIID